MAVRRGERAFVIMPFHEPYNTYYAEIYKNALESSGYEAVRGDDFFASRPVILDIMKAILDARLVLCDMSGKSANVFYELGLVHAIGTPAVLLSSNAEDIPFDVRHIRAIIYNPERRGWQQGLRRSICRAVDAVVRDKVRWPPPLVKAPTAEKEYVAKQFDGRVGKIFVKNTSAYPFKVTLWHPDSETIFHSWVLKPISKEYLHVSGEAINIGNDWGMQIGSSRVRSVGDAADWVDNEWRVSPDTFFESFESSPDPAAWIG
jgi:hypothetical protein